MSTQEKPRDRVMALPEELRKELLYLAHLDPEKQKSTLFHNVAVSGEKIQAMLDSAKREGAIEQVMQDEISLGLELPITDESQLIRWREDTVAQLEQSEESDK